MDERTIYIVNGSIPSWRVLIALQEKGLSFSQKRLFVMRSQRETKTTEFLTLNPRGQAPLLIEPEGTKINESLAILHYLELRYPQPSLLPSPENLQEYANTIAWIQEAEILARVYEPIENLFGNKPSEMSKSEREKIRQALSAITFNLDLWEQRVAKHTYLASDLFTLADCSFYPVLAYLMRRGLVLNPFLKLQEYELRVRKRLSAQASRPEGWHYNKISKTNLFKLAEAL